MGRDVAAVIRTWCSPQCWSWHLEGRWQALQEELGGVTRATSKGWLRFLPATALLQVRAEAEGLARMQGPGTKSLIWPVSQWLLASIS